MPEVHNRCSVCDRISIHYCERAEPEPEAKPFPLVKVKPTYKSLEARYGYGIEAMQ
jgi:hypothetical protein